MLPRCLLSCVLLLWGPAWAEAPVRVYAAASLTPALQDISAHWAALGHPAPQLVFGASSSLARQLEAGAPADVFASADGLWMDWLAQSGRVVAASRVDLLGNQLVLIAPRGAGFAVRLSRDYDLAGALRGPLCLGEPGVVPAGRYAQQSLEALGWWPALQGRLVGTDDVRAALAFVQRGECAAGIVYASDAVGDARVEVLARFPDDAHAPIVYPFALLTGAAPAAPAFLEFLRADPAAQAIFRRHGFSVPGPAP